MPPITEAARPLDLFGEQQQSSSSEDEKLDINAMRRPSNVLERRLSKITATEQQSRLVELMQQQ